MENNDILLNIINSSDYNSSLKLLAVTNPSILSIIKSIQELKEKESCKYCDAIKICRDLECMPLDCLDPVSVEIICPNHKYICGICYVKSDNKQLFLCDSCDKHYCDGCLLVCIRESGRVLCEDCYEV